MMNENEPEQEEEEEEDPLAAEPIHGRTQLRAQDFKAAWFAMPQVRTRLFGSVLVFAMLPISLTALQSPAALQIVMVSLIPLAAAAAGYAVFSGHGRWAKVQLGGHEPNMFEYSFDADGLNIAAPEQEACLSWRRLHACLETPQAFVIFVESSPATLVAKRAFSAKELARLREELRARIRRGRRRRGGGFAGTLLLWLVLVVVFLTLWRFLSPT